MVSCGSACSGYMYIHGEIVHVRASLHGPMAHPRVRTGGNGRQAQDCLDFVVKVVTMHSSLTAGMLVLLGDDVAPLAARSRGHLLPNYAMQE